MYTRYGAISTGDVVARHGRFFVVVRSRDRSLTLVPIRLACLPHHRSDVRPVDRQELAFAGLGESDFAVVCRERLIMARQEVVRIGVVPGAMWERITRAMEREDAVSAQEFCGGLGSALLAQTAFSGRRVSAARYS